MSLRVSFILQKNETANKQCRVLSFREFSSNWIVEDHWTEEELIELGVKSSIEKVDEDGINGFKTKILDFSKFIKDQSKQYKPLNYSGDVVVKNFTDILDWEKGNGMLNKEYMRIGYAYTFCPSNDGVKKETRQKKFPPCLFFEYADESDYSAINSCLTGLS